MKISEILSGVESLSMVMPEFQREYVWPIEDAKQLMVSLFRDYPTGCLLFWATENPPEIKNNAVDTSKLGLTNVILDGQQRLTTLYMLIKGEIPPYYTVEDLESDPRHLYFNVYNGEFQFYTKAKMETNPTWRSVTDCFNIEKVDAVDIATAYCEYDTEKEFKEAITTINSNLTKLRGILDRTYPILMVPKTANIDEAIDVFDRVNSKGTKLTDAELVLTHITGRWPQARRDLKDKLAKLSKKGFEFNLDFLTRCIVITLTESPLYKKNSKLKFENFSKQEYIDAWGKVSKALDYLIPILQQDGLITSSNDLSTNNVLVPLVAYLVKNDIRFKGNDKFKFLHWMFLALMWARYSGQTDQRLDRDIYILYNDSVDPIQGIVSEIEDQRGRLEVRASDLEGRGSGHPLYKMLYVITKSRKAIDWANGGPISGTIGDYYSIQSHHVFPQAYLYRTICNSDNHLDKKKVNEIANRAFITRDTNYSIKDTAPADYLIEVEKNYPGALEKQMIPLDSKLWDAEHYDKFLELRRESIANEINKFMEILKNSESKGEPETIHVKSWEEIIGQGENSFTEFKSTLSYCLREQKSMKYIEHSIAKTLAAFLNSEGGRLIVGIDDDGSALGLEDDFKLIGKGNSKDGFLLKFDNLVRDFLGKQNLTDIKTQFIELDSKDAFVVDVTPSMDPVFINHGGKEEFFVRGSASTQSYSMKEAMEYINRHWN